MSHIFDTEDSTKLATLKTLRELKLHIKEKSLNRGHTIQIDLTEELRKRREHEMAWEKRRQEKLSSGKKINIMFLCSRPAAWGVLKPACEAFIKDKRFNVKVISIPEINVEGAWESNSDGYDIACRVIDGYNPYTKEWFDIQRLEPDYVFFQTPYNGLRPESYDSVVVSSYAKICYSLYGMPMFKDDADINVSRPLDFLKDVFVVFTQTRQYHDELTELFNKTPLCDGHIIFAGDARLEAIAKLPKDTESAVWKYPRSAGKLRVVWTPRWTKRGNHSNFWDYKDKILELCRQNPDIELVSRPHPLTFPESLQKGYMSELEIEEYKNSYGMIGNASLDSRAEYQDTFVSSDVLITDVTSVYHDYTLTGKPVIYCHRADGLNEHNEAVIQGFYWTRNWQEVEDALNMIKSGNDPLKEKRLQIAKQMYYMPAEGVGNAVKNCIAEHFFSNKVPVQPDMISMSHILGAAL